MKDDLRELVKKAFEDALSGLLEEADAERCERTAEREAYRAGHQDRSLATSSGEVWLHIAHAPELKAYGQRL